MNKYSEGQNDDTKSEILTWLDKECFRGKYWHTKNQVSRGIGISFARSTELVNQLIHDGFLVLRDSDNANADFVLSIKPELRKKR